MNRDPKMQKHILNFLTVFNQKKITPYTSQLRCHLAVGTEDYGKVTMMLGRNA